METQEHKNNTIIDIDPEILEKASEEGAREAARAMSKISGQSVLPKSFKVGKEALADIHKFVKSPYEEAVITYAQVLIGDIPGISLLTLTIDNALDLADLMIGLRKGEPGIEMFKEMGPESKQKVVYMEYDKLLTILSNAYISTLTQYMEATIEASSVSILSPQRVKGVRDFLISKATTAEEPMAVFRTELEVVDTDINALLVLVFSKDAAAAAAAKT